MVLLCCGHGICFCRQRWSSVHALFCLRTPANPRLFSPDDPGVSPQTPALGCRITGPLRARRGSSTSDPEWITSPSHKPLLQHSCGWAQQGHFPQSRGGWSLIVPMEALRWDNSTEILFEKVVEVSASKGCLFSFLFYFFGQVLTM